MKHSLGVDSFTFVASMDVRELRWVFFRATDSGHVGSLLGLISYGGRYVQTIVKKHAQIITGKYLLKISRPLLAEVVKYERPCQLLSKSSPRLL